MKERRLQASTGTGNTSKAPSGLTGFQESPNAPSPQVKHPLPKKNAKKMVTQCPLLPGELFPFYQFTANPAGTFWYHSHTAFQRDDGLSGIFVVRGRDVEDLGCDLSEHVIHLQEWFRSPAKERYARGNEGFKDSRIQGFNLIK